jgi:(E)-benzylidenesuccinyl-CoA hydratase
VGSNTVLFDLQDKVAVITLNRPEVRNAMNRELSQALIEALQRVREEADIRAAVITGAGRTFSAGADLKERTQSGRAADASVASVIEANRTASFARMAMGKPLLAVIDGYCLAAGFELALLCDMRICTPEARFALPEIVRGFFPGGGGPQRLMRAIP